MTTISAREFNRNFTNLLNKISNSTSVDHFREIFFQSYGEFKKIPHRTISILNEYKKEYHLDGDITEDDILYVLYLLCRPIKIYNFKETNIMSIIFYDEDFYKKIHEFKGNYGIIFFRLLLFASSTQVCNILEDFENNKFLIKSPFNTLMDLEIQFSSHFFSDRFHERRNMYELIKGIFSSLLISNSQIHLIKNKTYAIFHELCGNSVVIFSVKDSAFNKISIKIITAIDTPRASIKEVDGIFYLPFKSIYVSKKYYDENEKYMISNNESKLNELGKKKYDKLILRAHKINLNYIKSMEDVEHDTFKNSSKRIEYILPIEYTREVY